jgi:hypothetical protein
MRYTLFTFHVFHGELKDQLGDLTELGRTLAETEKHRVDISEGVCVFQTKKGWQDMHRLRNLLVSKKRPYVELPFEEALAGYFVPSVVDKLRELGKSSGQEISLLNLHPE